jgi:hypothetical protein
MERKEAELVDVDGTNMRTDSNWQAPVNAIMNLWVQGAVGNALTTLTTY